MGTLVAMHYRTKLFANLADHTYVRCGTGKVAWSCWGGKKGGKPLRQGAGSTKRANSIAGKDEKAGIKCYLVNGVCHQAANRILLPAGITVRGAKGYNVSEALYGTYGKVGIWPCRSPFHQHPNVSGDLPACQVPAAKAKALAKALTDTEKGEWQYLKGVLGIYREAEPVMKSKNVSAVTEMAGAFHLRLFQYMAEYNLGPMLDAKLEKKLLTIRGKTEKRRAKTEAAYAHEKIPVVEFAAAVDREAIRFQEEMANALTDAQYASLFDLKRGETVHLADPRIVKKLAGG